MFRHFPPSFLPSLSGASRLAALSGASLAILAASAAAPAAAATLQMNLLKTYTTGIFDDSAAEISAFDSATNRIFVTNSSNNTVDVYDLLGGNAPINTFNVGGGGPNSVAVKNGVVAVAVEAATATDPGSVKFYDVNGNLQNTVAVGALPDMLTFTPDGSKIVVANEGEPGAVDPEGTISIIDISGGVGSASVATANFQAFNGQEATLRAQGVRLFPGVSTANDVEPEYITVSADGSKAYVALQEANSLAIVDLNTNTVTDIKPLGVKDHSLPGNALDPSDRDSGINIANHPVYGMFMPDSIASYDAGGQTYIVTANEGDARSEDDRVKNLTLDPAAFPNAAALQDDAVLGRLEVSTIDGDTDGDGDYDELYAYGARSFSIFDVNGNLVFDSGDDFEQITTAMFPAEFNSSNDDNTDFDSRSDAKGPEPEALTLGVVNGMTLAFIGLERMGGIMVYDITDPTAPNFLLYQNDRDYSLPDTDPANPMGPEGMVFVDAGDNALGKNLLIVANEVSGSTDVYSVEAIPLPPTLALLAGGLLGLGLLRRRWG